MWWRRHLSEHVLGSLLRLALEGVGRFQVFLWAVVRLGGGDGGLGGIGSLALGVVEKTIPQ